MITKKQHGQPQGETDGHISLTEPHCVPSFPYVGDKCIEILDPHTGNGFVLISSLGVHNCDAFICITWILSAYFVSPLSVDIIHILCIYPHFVDIIRILGILFVYAVCPACNYGPHTLITKNRRRSSIAMHLFQSKKACGRPGRQT